MIVLYSIYFDAKKISRQEKAKEKNGFVKRLYLQKTIK